MKKRVGILISGRGSNMSSIIEATKDLDYPAGVVKVISNKADAYGIEIAKANNISTEVIDHHPFGKDRLQHEMQIYKSLSESNVEIVCLAGYMRILTPWLVEKYSGRMLNIHPSLLPKYPGLHTHQRALDAGDSEAGVTVHIVTEVMDVGPILGQAIVPILPNDTEDLLSKRVLESEHILYPKVLKDFICLMK
jgi:phosphoribosylglycinamide formyltransferase-1